jgi:hypothetical protein
VRAENLTEKIHAAPFRPFTIHLADGKSIAVPHPDFIAHRPAGRVAVVVEEDDRTHTIDVGLITRLEVAPPVPAGSPSPAPNGGE